MVKTTWRFSRNSLADLGGAPTVHPVQLVLPVRQSGREPEFCTSIFGQGATSQINGTVHQLAWMGGHQSDQPELCTGLLGWVATGQIDQNLFTSLLGWVATSQINWNLCTGLLGWGATSQINWNLCTGLLGWGATSQINWGAVHLVYWHTYMEVTIHFRWRSCSN